MATNLVFNAIAPEVLKNDNYSNWSVCVKNYLRGQDLWDIIKTVPESFENEENEAVPESFENEENEATENSWEKKNALALHAIQISCGPDMLSKIRKIEIAKDAWDTLAKMQEPQTLRAEDAWYRFAKMLELRTQRDSALGSSSGDQDWEATRFYAKYRPLLNVVDTGDWDATKDFLDHHQNEHPLEAIVSRDFYTLLHFAVVKRHVKIAKKLVRLMSPEILRIRDSKGNTALCYAIELGFDKMVRCMVEKDRELLSIANSEGELPVVLACVKGNKHMTRYLYHHTTLQALTPQCWDAGTRWDAGTGAAFLCYCFTSKMIDITLDLLQKYPGLAFASDIDGTSLMGLLSRMPSAFKSGSQLGFWKRWIYSCIPVPPTSPSNDTRIDIPTQNQRQTNQGSIIPQVFDQLHGLLSGLLKFLGIKQIYDTKLIHVGALQILRVICSEIHALNSSSFTRIENFGVIDALFRAVKHGIVEFFMEIIRVDPDALVRERDANNRSMFQCAIVYRQEKILSLIYGIHSGSAMLTTSQDEFGHNMLHLAGMLAPSTRLDRVPGAALQMQRELQWFKEVENIVPSKCKEALDRNGHTPRELFTKEHRELVKEGQKWMKETASSCAFVSALIVTIMFASAFTVPGGNSDDTGFPIFSDKNVFKVFILCDAISFLSATTSILIFLGILTSRYAEEDFLKSLPKKMILGLTTLFISIATMIIAFCATLSLMLQGQMRGTFILVLVLASMPIIVFALLQFPLLLEISISTYGPSIFNRNTKSW